MDGAFEIEQVISKTSKPRKGHKSKGAKLGQDIDNGVFKSIQAREGIVWWNITKSIQAGEGMEVKIIQAKRK